MDSQKNEIDIRRRKRETSGQAYLLELFIINTKVSRMTQVQTSSQVVKILVALIFNISHRFVKDANFRRLERVMSAQPVRHPRLNTR